MEIRCFRCGEPMDEKNHMIQTITYLGGMGPRHDICKNCFISFTSWLASGNHDGWDDIAKKF